MVSILLHITAQYIYVVILMVEAGRNNSHLMKLIVEIDS